MVETLGLIYPDDWHVHVREDEMLDDVLHYTETAFARALLMPNTRAGIKTVGEKRQYQAQVGSVQTRRTFRPFFTLKLTPETTPQVVVEANEEADILALKYYPEGVTTGSHNGVSSIESIEDVLEKMEEVGLALSVHAAMPGSELLDEEEDFISVLTRITEEFPSLRLIVEHISTAAMLQWVMDQDENVAGSITLHHLLLTTSDVLGRSHNFCKPVANSAHDRQSLLEAVFDGENTRLIFGSDSAPHLRSAKETVEASAGVFSAPVLLPRLWQLFVEELGSVDEAIAPFEMFTARNGASFYHLPLNEGRIKLSRLTWHVDKGIVGKAGCYVPFLAGEAIDWQVVAA